MNFRPHIEKLQALPESKKKIILWSVVAVLAVIMGFFWVRGAINNFSKIGESIGEIKMPQINTSDMPSLNLQGIEDQTKQNMTSLTKIIGSVGTPFCSICCF